MSKKMNRRDALAAAGLVTGSLLVPGSVQAKPPLPQTPYKHSVCRWCFSATPLDSLARSVKALGMQSIELLKPEEWKTVYDTGLECAVATDDFISLTQGFNNPVYHEGLQKQYPGLIRQAADQGIPQVICFSGNREAGISEEQGIENCAKGLAPLVKEAEQRGITLIMELLNSKVDHKGYQCDHTPWGVKLVEKIGSPRFKLLYDIYHMQIMEGDIR